ncbi:MAG: hypothetical protein GXP25_06580 [Planctomycetes bacterium]|nr:hypothetical protein [Planctomycetota bacterium]
MRRSVLLVLAIALSPPSLVRGDDPPQWRIHGSGSTHYTLSASSRGLTFVQTEEYNITRRDYAGLFDPQKSELRRRTTAKGREIVITAVHDQLGVFKRVLCRGKKSLTYAGEFNIHPNAIGAEFAFVSLYLAPDMVEGAEWVAEVDNGETNGVLPDPEPRQDIVVGLKRIQFDSNFGLLTFRFDGDGSWTLDDLHGLSWAKGRPYRLDLQMRFPPTQGLEAKFAVEITFEPRFAPADWFAMIDTTGQANVALRDNAPGDRKGGWIDQGADDLRHLMWGVHRFLGVPFQILNPNANNGRSVIVLQGAERPYFPAQAGPIPVGMPLRRLYFLHACAWADDGVEAGQYRIEYQDGSRVVLPLRIGANIADWWSQTEPANPHVATAWQGENDVCPHDVRLYAFKWDNPRPDVEIKSITAVGSGEGPVLGVVAITGVKSGETAPEIALKLLDYLFVKKERELLAWSRPVDEWLPIDLPWQAGKTNDLDISALLDAPAGRHGFVQSRGGRLVFADGTRARFWGTAIGAACAFGPHETSERIARHLAQCGCNLVRIHGLQNPSTTKGMSLVDYVNYDDSQHWNPEVLDRFDYFIAQLKKNGIYVYVDLLTRRRFREADGLPGVEAFMDGKRFGWGQGPCAKPVSTFNGRMIELQREFAARFLTHENPYTGLRLVDDPAIALVEITNENSMFWQTNYKELPKPYADELRERWNEWLLRKYHERDALAAGWARIDEPLSFDEDPRLKTVRFRDVHRNFDMALFAYETMRNYHAGMVRHLRSIGVKVPITGHNSPYRLPDIRGVVDSRASFLSIHGYWDLINHFTRRKPRQRPPVYDNPLHTLVARLAQGRTRNLPHVITEVNYCWPNKFRAEGMPLVAAYASLQDWDGVIWFSHSGGYGINTWDNWKDSIYYHTQMVKDPSLWGQFRMGAQIFLGGKVARGHTLIENAYSDTDCFFDGGGRSGADPLSALVHFARCQNAFFRKRYKGKADVVVSSGLTPDASYADAARAFIFAGQPFVDLPRTVEDRLRPIEELYPQLEYYTGPARLLFQGIGFDAECIEVDLKAGIRTRSIPPGSRAIGVDEGRGVALGFINNRHCIVPDLLEVDRPDRMLLYRILMDALNWWGYTALDHGLADRRLFISDTGELTRDFGKGVFTINAPKAQGAAGFIGGGEPIELSQVSILSGSPHGAITLVSLDDAPLFESERILLTAVADAANTGQDPAEGKEGARPVLFDPIEAGIGLRCRNPAAMRVTAVDPQTGQISGPVRTTVSGSELRFSIGPKHRTIFYLIEAE